MKVPHLVIDIAQTEMDEAALLAALEAAGCMTDEGTALFPRLDITDIAICGPQWHTVAVEIAGGYTAYLCLVGEGDDPYHEETETRVALFQEREGQSPRKIIEGEGTFLMEREPDALLFTAADGTEVRQRALVNLVREIGIHCLMSGKAA